jgi:hypothetical protein
MIMDTKAKQTRISEQRKKKLCRVYKSKPQIGLVLGAGVTCDSEVPLYLKLTLDLCKLALQKNLLRSEAPRNVMNFLETQEKLALKDYKKVTQVMNSLQITPDEIVLFLKTYLENKQELAKHIRKTLFSKVEPRKMDRVSAKLFENGKNDTLKSILCFCAARVGSVLAPNSKHRIETNPKVGGILTTNYDNLVEGAFGTKFRRKNMLKPVGRVTSRESLKDRRVIPVYHIHGYVSYVAHEDDLEDRRVSDMLVIAEDDYFERFYDPMGFSSYVAMSFLRRFPCLFIGSEMKDKNIRRFLYHLCKERGDCYKNPNHFAILKKRGVSRDAFMDSILLSYGVSTIWIEDYNKIPEILRDVYTSEEGVEPKDWKYLRNF